MTDWPYIYKICQQFSSDVKVLICITSLPHSFHLTQILIVTFFQKIKLISKHTRVIEKFVLNLTNPLVAITSVRRELPIDLFAQTAPPAHPNQTCVLHFSKVNELISFQDACKFASKSLIKKLMQKFWNLWYKKETTSLRVTKVRGLPNLHRFVKKMFFPRF